MSQRVEELSQKWRRDPDPDTTIALCVALQGSEDASLVQEIGEVGRQKYPDNVPVLVAIGRMYLDAQRLLDAQSILVAAGKIAPREGVVYRFLGEVLLRRGDAERARKVLDRAVELGAGDPEALFLLDRARVFKSMQERVGMGAVAAEIARIAPPGTPFEHSNDSTTVVRPIPPETLEESRPKASRPGDEPNLVSPPSAAPTPTSSSPAPATRGSLHRSPLLLVGCALLFAGAAVAGVFVFRKKGAERREGDAILQTLEGDVRAGRVASVPSIESALRRLSALNVRSPRYALDNLRARVTLGLLKGEGEIPDEALRMAKQTGIPNDQLAFAQIASLLFRHDVAGAIALMDKGSGSLTDAWVQFLGGLAVERAGDHRLLTSYATATQLEPSLVLAQIARARSSLFGAAAFASGGWSPESDGAELARAFRATYPDRPEGAALMALVWARDPPRSKQAPAEIPETLARAAELPALLAAVPHIVAAVEAIRAGTLDKARAKIEMGIGVADAPAIASWLGELAIEAEDVAQAARAARVVASLAPTSIAPRLLNARVALLEGRIEEARQATEGIHSRLAEEGIVRAIIAYEQGEAREMVGALAYTSSAAQTLPSLRALDLAAGRPHFHDVPSGDVLGLAEDHEAAWGDLIAMDYALDTGNLQAARAIAARWGAAAARPARAARLARLARYDHHLDLADTLTQGAISAGMVTVRVLVEQAFELAARGKQAEIATLVANYSASLGKLEGWLRAYGLAASGKIKEARKAASTMANVDPGTLPGEIVRAAALGAMKDRTRGARYVGDLMKSAHLNNPDVVAAAEELHVRSPSSHHSK